MNEHTSQILGRMAAHRKLKTNLLRWLVTDRPQNLITGPIVYSR